MLQRREHFQRRLLQEVSFCKRTAHLSPPALSTLSTCCSSCRHVCFLSRADTSCAHDRQCWLQGNWLPASCAQSVAATQAQRVQQDSGAARSLTHAASTKAPTTHKDPSKKPPTAEGTSACVEQQGSFNMSLEQYCTSRQFLQHNRPLGPVVPARSVLCSSLGPEDRTVQPDLRRSLQLTRCSRMRGCSQRENLRERSSSDHPRMHPFFGSSVLTIQ